MFSTMSMKADEGIMRTRVEIFSGVDKQLREIMGVAEENSADWAGVGATHKRVMLFRMLFPLGLTSLG